MTFPANSELPRYIFGNNGNYVTVICLATDLQQQKQVIFVGLDNKILSMPLTEFSQAFETITEIQQLQNTVAALRIVRETSVFQQSFLED